MRGHWLTREIGAGLAKLLALRLDGCPSDDMIEATVVTWIDSLTFNRVWDEGRDAPRLRHAFKVLGATRLNWPKPLELVENLPRVEALLALPAKPVDPETAAANIREIMAMLNAPREPAPVAEDRPPLADIEAGLRKHYTDQKSKAAGEGGNDDATNE